MSGFDSGSTHAFALREGEWPADVYLEGSDQHRGWFQSSLLEACGTRGRAPYKAVVTHGFIVDEKGMKMSKSLGNVLAPNALAEKYGADIFRLWVASVDYNSDPAFGERILQSAVDAYRKLRNTLRYLLGALDGFYRCRAGGSGGHAGSGALHAPPASRQTVWFGL